MTHERRAVALLVLTAVLWSLGGVLIKSIAWNAPAIAGARSAIAIVVLLALMRPLRVTWSRYQIFGAIAYAVTVTLFVLANKMTTAANAIFLQYTAPIWIALCGPWFLNERPRWYDWPIMAVIIVGIALFFMDHLTLAGFWGNILALVTGVSFAWLAMLLRKQQGASPLGSILLGNVLTVLVCSPFMITSLPRTSDSVALGLVLVGILGTFQLGVTYVLYSRALQHVTALEAMLIPAIEPILNPTIVLLVLGERPGLRAIMGGVLVLGAATTRGVLTSRGR